MDGREINEFVYVKPHPKPARAASGDDHAAEDHAAEDHAAGDQS